MSLRTRKDDPAWKTVKRGKLDITFPYNMVLWQKIPHNMVLWQKTTDTSFGMDLLADLPPDLQLHVLRFAVYKFNWWNLKGEWKVGEFFIGEIYTMVDLINADDDSCYEVGEFIGHYVDNADRVDLLTVFKKVDSPIWLDAPIFLDLKLAWGYAPYMVLDYYHKHILKIRKDVWAEKFTWWNSKYVANEFTCPGTCVLDVQKFFIINGGWIMTLRKYYATGRLIDAMKEREWIDFGKHMLSTYKLVFDSKFTGNVTVYDKDMFGDYDHYIFGLPIDYYRMIRKVATQDYLKNADDLFNSDVFDNDE
jgi:hypothetical protein